MPWQCRRGLPRAGGSGSGADSLRPYGVGSLQGWPWIPTTPIDTREEKNDNSPVGSKRGQNIVGKRTGGRSAPTTVNSSVRTREYLTTAEIERLMAAVRKSSRYGHRDATMILIGYRHGLRASELCDLQWSQVELATGRLHVRRAKNRATRYARCDVCSANRGRPRTSL